jgi:hypothetical protein
LDNFSHLDSDYRSRSKNYNSIQCRLSGKNLALLVGEVSKIETITMLMSPVGLRPEKGCAGDVRQKLKSTNPTSHQRGRLTSTNPKLSKK